MENRIEKLINQAKERQLLLRSGHLMGHQLGQRLVVMKTNNSLTRSEINRLLDSNCLLVIDVIDSNTKLINNTLTLLKMICSSREIRSPFVVCEHYWCVNPYLKITQNQTKHSNI